MATSQEKYIVCSLKGEAEALEAGSWVLLESGAEGVIQEENGADSTVSAYFPAGRWESIKPMVLKNLEPAKVQFPSLSLAKEAPVDPADWAEKWKEFHKPVIMGSLWIGPPWLKNEIPDDKLPLIIDPGQAFGTGGHETTRICLALLSGWIRDGNRGNMLDVGTGSGVLALAGLLQGLESALALDNDPLAVEAALENAEVNSLTDRLEVRDSDLTLIEDEFSLITANLTGPILKNNAKELVRLLAPEGRLILSGILIEETDEIRRIFRELRFVKAIQMGEWTGMILEKPGEA